ncbi:hypothetical protein [Roseovarius arcticus]|uniref:hypothetical protein n=1 Tax=Roseovarius arcticus TaxID=2547404 RepID=UPI00111089FC|nr:hypothetical protein [Roseovarius arcticus]
MTDDRAASIASAAGVELMEWRGCAGIDDCLLMSVMDDEEEEFVYVISSENCVEIEIDLDDPRAGPITRDPSRPFKHSARRGSKAASARTGSVEGKPENRTNPVGHTNNDCFGGETAVLRARISRSLSIDNLNLAFHGENIWEVPDTTGIYELLFPDGDGWKPLATERFLAFQQWTPPVPDEHRAGVDQQGHAYEIVDPQGVVLGSDEESYIVYEASGDTQTKKEMCQGEQDRFDKRTAPLSGSAVDLVCGATPMFDRITFSAGFVSGTKEVPYCDFFHDLASELTGYYSQSVYDDCMENPGRYDPDYPPEPGPYSLAGYLGTAPVVALQIILPLASCPISHTKVIGYRVGGLDCTQTTKYICAEQNDVCTCDTPATDEVCTGGARPGESDPLP